MFNRLAIVRPLLEKLNRREGEKTREIMLVLTILIIISASWVTEVIGKYLL